MDPHPSVGAATVTGPVPAVHQVSAVTDGTMRGVVPWRARVRRVWPVAKYIIGLGLAALAFYQLIGHKTELSEATVALGHLRWAWVVLGVVAEGGSFLAFALLQRMMLRAGGVNVAVGPMAAITMAANAITNSIPAGSAIAPVYSFRQYRQRGADQALAGWSVVAAFVAESVTLAVVAAVGVSVAGAEGASLDLVGVTVTVLILAIAMGVVFVQKRALVWTVSAALRLCQRLTGWPRGELAHHIDRIILRLTVVRLSPGQMVGALRLALVNWLLDCGCLALSFLAVGAPVPWKGLLLAYGAGQLAANLPITPGGLGVVEGSLTIALVAYGGAAPSTVVAVLLYRLLSFWLALPVGWGAWGWLAWIGRRRPWPRSAAADDADLPVSPGPPGTDADGAAVGHPDDDIREAVGE
jgi:putative heme transporter